MRLTDLLREKAASAVYCIQPQASLQEAVDRLVQHNIGSLLVMLDGNQHSAPLGIITERDILRALIKVQHPLSAYFVGDFMTRQLISAEAGQSTQEAMSLMTEHRVRHLPIFDQGELVGLLSIGDLVKHEAHQLTYENQCLKQYLVG